MSSWNAVSAWAAVRRETPYTAGSLEFLDNATERRVEPLMPSSHGRRTARAVCISALL